VLAVVRWAKTAENAVDYSLNNTVRHALFLPLNREEKYKAKQAVDTLPWRLGDLLSAGIVFLGSTVLALGTRGYALVNVALVAVWIVLMVAIGRQYRRRTEVRP
jgi:AAA family ATP:ADP antiporter